MIVFTRPVGMPELVGTEHIGWVVSQLALARGTSADTPTLTAYMDALADVDPALVERACFDLARLSRSEYEAALPAAGTIRDRVSAILRADLDAERARVALLPAPKSDDDSPRYFCPDCHDEWSGWRMFACGGTKSPVVDPKALARVEDLTARHCGRREPHAAHPYAERCSCWQHNPVVARRRAAQQVRRAS